MTDLVCLECEWFVSSFDNKSDIEEYLAKTELIETHFADQDCPKCEAEESLEVFYKMCTSCGESEVDCTCDIDLPEISDEEAEKLREDIIELVEEKDSTRTQQEQERLEFKEKDLRRMAERLIEDTWA